ncbi:MAG TPA: glutamate mutase L [Bacillota bacterium]|nr:glutamate mutase L [Bacillota bacterium]
MEKQRYLIVDVGSTTTKAILIELVDQEYRMTFRGESGTTVEAPNEDVMIGIRRAVGEIARLSGYPLLDESGVHAEAENTEFLATSSAGGGLQVLVCGLAKAVTGESAQRAALGAGAIILDVFSTDDERPVFRRMEALRRARPDMVLLAGGVDGGNSVNFAVEFCDMLNSAKPQPRFGKTYRMPVIYAGNNLAAPLVQDTLDEVFDLSVMPNLRPGFEEENLGPTRDKIHELFLSHVMEQAPGYFALKRQTTAPILPTPLAVGRIMTHLAERDKTNILGADIGGATTDVFSVIDGTFNRTVSANLGMSYSSGNVLVNAGVANILRWLPFPCEEMELENAIANKLIHPTSVPATLRDLAVEQALAREALRLSLAQHIELAKQLPGHEISALKQVFSSQAENLKSRAQVIDLGTIGLLVGSGGVLSHAPRRAQATAMLLDAFQPKGFCFLAVDSIFMMPHLGTLTQLNSDAALNVLEKDCFIRLGPSFSLFGLPDDPDLLGKPVLAYSLSGPSGEQQGTVAYGDIVVLPLTAESHGKIRLQPSEGGDVGRGKNAVLQMEVSGGAVGVILDCRGRDIVHLDTELNWQNQAKWLKALGAFTEAELQALGGIG